ncbi:Flp pilus assembly protein CpaB [Algicella marina]|uniref:Flp pilus assembly protein CpaB n=1 Tax=Algicella marina TaxID=2683284 RepID=A0A6P1T6A1_9RHOB|nr:Flp pilus assembly protein CpaB [Algicella marina]QHQ37233.1 Flp pilus assembly protein CpaB [Algicella marina]
MRIVFALVFLFGIGIAGFAAYLAMEQFKGLQAQNRMLNAKAAKVVETTSVILAKTQLRYGQELRREHAYEVSFPKDAVPENAFTSMEELFGPEDDTPPRAVLRTVDPGEIISDRKVTRFGQDAGVSSMLNKGMRAFTIRVDVLTGVSGFLQPGDRVDVFWSGEQRGRPVTKLLMEDVDIIAIDQSADEDANRPTVARTVTVEVTPLIVATLAQAQASGRLSLALRGAEEEQIMGELLEVTQESMLGLQEEEVVEEVEEEKCFNTIRRELQVTRIEVPCP